MLIKAQLFSDSIQLALSLHPQKRIKQINNIKSCLT